MLRKLKQFATAALLALLALAPASPPDANIVVQSGAKYISTSVASELDMDADFAARATAVGVTYATNASSVYVARVLQPARAITDSTSLRNEALDTGGTPTNLVRDTVLKLSGTGSIQLITPDSAGTDGGAHWSYRLNGTDDTQFTRFYAQMAIYQTRNGLAYRYQLDSASQPAQLKLWNIEQNGAGQIAITARRFLGFPSYFTQTGSFNNSGGASLGTPNPWSTGQEWIQNAIDNGGSLSTKDQYVARYGPLQGIAADVTGAVSGQPAYSAGDPYLYNRTWPSGWPDTRAVAAGAVPFNLDGWTVITIFVDYNVSDPAHSTFQGWAAPYGEPPTLIFNQIGDCPLGTNDVYRRLELLSYDTHRDPEIGVRPEIRTNYTEVIVSEAPIQFPGGFDLPGAQDAPPEESPAWTHDIAIGKWAQISGDSPTAGFSATNNIDDVKPSIPAIDGNDGNDAVTKAWAAASFAPSVGNFGALLEWNGGHTNYYGNEVYAFDMDTRTWSRITEPYPTPSFSITDGWWPANGLQVNGSPSVPHTYDLVEYDPVRDSMYTFRTMADNTPNNVSQIGEFPLGTRVWQKRALASFTVGSGGWSVYDSVRDVFVYRGGSGASVSTRTIQYDPDANTFTYFNPSGGNISQTDSVAAYDPIQDLIVVLNGSTTALYSVNPASLGTNPTLLTESGAPSKAAAAGFEYSSEKAAFLYYSSGANVYQVKNVSGTWTWTNLTSGSNTVTPEDMEANGVYSKFRVVEYPDGTSVAIVVKRTGATGTGGVYAFRISALTPEPKLHYFTESEGLALAA